MSTVAVCAAVALAPMAATANPWYRLQTEHFTVYSNFEPSLSKFVITRLEAYDEVLHRPEVGAPAIDDAAAKPRMVVYIPKNLDDFHLVTPDWQARALEQIGQRGQSSPLTTWSARRECADGAADYDSHDVPVKQGQPDDINPYDLSSMYGTYVQDYLARAYTDIMPHWYLHGLSNSLSSISMTGRKVFMPATAYDSGRLATTVQWVPFGDILRDDYDFERLTINTIPELDHYVIAHRIFLSQADILSDYVRQVPARRDMMTAYVQDMNGGADPVTAFESRFGIKMADLPAALKPLVYDRKPFLTFSLPDKADPAIEMTQLPASADDLLILKSGLETCPLDSDKAYLLKTVRSRAAKYPGDAFAQRVLERAEITLGDPATVQAELEKQVTDAPQDAEARYLLGRLYYAMATSPADGYMAKARDALAHAYKLDPTSAPTLYYLSLAQDDLGAVPNATAVNAAVEASNLMPLTRAYSFRAARVLVESGRGSDAAAMLVPIAPYSLQARQAIVAIQGGKAVDDVLKTMAPPQPVAVKGAD